MVTILLFSFLVFLLLGIPLVFVVGSSATLALFSQKEISPLITVQRIFAGMDSFPLMAIPFFLLAGEIMNAAGITKRLVNFSDALVGQFRGGLALVNVVANIFMAGISGSCAADCAAIGSVLIPTMKEDGYDAPFSAIVTAAASTLGPIIPPSIIMVIYSSITGLSVGALFLSGVIPGLLIGFSQMALVSLYAHSSKYSKYIGKKAKKTFSFRHLTETFVEGFFALVMPGIIVGGIVIGFVTPTEAGVMATIYGLIIGLFVYRKLTLAGLKSILLSAAGSSASVVLIVAVSSTFSWVLAITGTTQFIMEFLASLTTNPIIAMLIIIAFLLIVGMFVETIAAAVIFVPFMHPLASLYGFDPLHLGLVIILTLMIGQLTPPVGIMLYLACGIAKVKMSETLIHVFWFVLFMLIVTLTVAFVPKLALFLPNKLLGAG